MVFLYLHVMLKQNINNKKNQTGYFFHFREDKAQRNHLESLWNELTGKCEKHWGTHWEYWSMSNQLEHPCITNGDSF